MIKHLQKSHSNFLCICILQFSVKICEIMILSKNDIISAASSCFAHGFPLPATEVPLSEIIDSPYCQSFSDDELAGAARGLSSHVFFIVR